MPLPELADGLVLRRRGVAADQVADVGHAASQNRRSLSLNKPPRRCALCDAGAAARSAASRSLSTLHTAPSAAPARERAVCGAAHKSPCTSNNGIPFVTSSSSQLIT